jgi:exopolyphosphatase/guanosine-5'-triphosphate,3'-diphosphate pyrophosphatase
MYDTARLEVSLIRQHYKSKRWDDCVGSSGTLQAIEILLQVYNWTEFGIDRQGLKQLEKKLLEFEHIDDIDLQGLNSNRRNVILAGVAITAAIFDELGIEIMRTSKGALREGVVYDLLGRLTHEDVRERTISALTQRYNVDESLADIVRKRARILYLSTRKAWQLDNADWQLLGWAARTHEIGMAISHKHFNRHGAYLLRNGDLPGFAQHEQETMALLVYCHRGKIPVDRFSDMTDADREHLLRLLTLIRLANIFKYVEQLEYLPEFRVDANADSISLQFPEDWLEQHPLTSYALEQETHLLQKVGIGLEIH